MTYTQILLNLQTRLQHLKERLNMFVYRGILGPFPRAILAGGKFPPPGWKNLTP